MNPDDFIEVTMNDQRMTLFIVCDVPRNAKFETLTRKEISVSFDRSHATPAISLASLLTADVPVDVVTIAGDRMGQVVGLADMAKAETQGVGEKVLLGRTLRRASLLDGHETGARELTKSNSTIHAHSPLKQWIKLHRQQASRPNTIQGEALVEMDEESEGYTPVPTAAEPVAIDTQVRTDGITASRKVEIELGDPAVATHISAATGEAKKNDRGETLDALFSRFLGESTAGRGMSSPPVRNEGPATQSEIATQAAQETSQGNAMQALLAKLASPAVPNATTLPTYASPAPPAFPTSAYAMPPAQAHASPGQVHARNLLSMLSPKATPATVTPAASAPPINFPPQVNYASHPPGSVASTRDDKEGRRKALLDNMMAGLGQPASQQPNHMTGGSNSVHYMSSQHAQPLYQPVQGLPSHSLPPQFGPASFPSHHHVPPHLAGHQQMPPPGPAFWNGNNGNPGIPLHPMQTVPFGMIPVPSGPHQPQTMLQGLTQPPAMPPPKQRDAGDLLNALLGPRPPG